MLSRDPIHASLIRKGMDERYHIDANNWICSILRKAIILKRKMYKQFPISDIASQSNLLLFFKTLTENKYINMISKLK